jgi:hypothetical protein
MRYCSLELNYAPTTIELIAPTDEQEERLFSMMRQQVDPKRVVAGPESWSAEVIRVHTGAKLIALAWIKALKTALRDDDWDHVL